MILINVGGSLDFFIRVFEDAESEIGFVCRLVDLGNGDPLGSQLQLLLHARQFVGQFDGD